MTALVLAGSLLLVARHGVAQSSASFPEPAPAPAVPAPAPAPAPYTPAPAPPALPANPYTPAPTYAPVPVTPAPLPAPEPAFPPNSSAPPLLPYRAGLPVPAGYRVEHRSATGLLVGGLLTLGASYAAALAVAANEKFENGTGYLAIPVAGPWAAIGGRSFRCLASPVSTLQAAQKATNKCVGAAFGEVTTVVFLTADGLIQATGAVLFFVGLGSGYDELVRADLPKTAVTVLPEGGMAFSVSGNF